jgi:hypothetical protein
VGLFQYRVLVPYLARPIYRLLVGHTGAWSAVALSMLIVNAACVSTALLFLLRIGRMLSLSATAALLASLLYLLNFNVANGQLIGYVDAGESLLYAVLIWALLSKRWYLLPLVGILGALAKEGFVPVATAFSLGWCLSGCLSDPGRRVKIVWPILLGIAGISSYAAIRWALSSGAVSMGGDFSTMTRGFHQPFDKSLTYGFIWLLPLALVRIREFPRDWIVATLCGLAAIAFLVSWTNSATGMVRYAFSLGGGLLSLSAALALEKMVSSQSGLPLARGSAGCRD